MAQPKDTETGRPFAFDRLGVRVPAILVSPWIDKGTVVSPMNPDGSIPSDNPFYTSATGNDRAIWALGLRNPFTFGVQPGSGRIFIDDVGQNSWRVKADHKRLNIRLTYVLISRNAQVWPAPRFLIESRSICFRKFTGNSRSSSNEARSLSPISLTIARLCWESMSTEFGIQFSQRTPTPSMAPERKERRPSPLAIVRERLFLNSGPIGPLAIRDLRRS